MSAAIAGAIVGVGVSYLPSPNNIISNVLFNGAAGAASDTFAQYISHYNGSGTWNKGETLGAAGGGAVFGMLVHPIVPLGAAEPFALVLPTAGAVIGAGSTNKPNAP